MKKILAVVILAIICVGVGVLLYLRGQEGAGKVRIGVTQIATHPGIDAIRQGFLDEMERLGHKNGVDVIYDQTNAQGDMPTAQSIAQKYVQDGCDLIFAISTPSSQAVAKAVKGTDIPLVFGAVTDPVAAGLVERKTADLLGYLKEHGPTWREYHRD